MFQKLLPIFAIQSCVAMDCYYKIDFARLDDARNAIEAIRPSDGDQLYDQFLKITPKHKTITDDLKNSVLLEAIKDNARDYRNYDDAVMNLADAKTIEAVHNMVIEFLSDPKNFKDGKDRPELLDKYLSELFDYKEKKENEFEHDVRIFNYYISEFSQHNTSDYKKYVNQLFGIEKNPNNSDNEISESIFNILVSTGFIKTQIETTIDFVYNPGNAVGHFMDTKPDVNNLILGCGHHFYGDIVYKLKLEDTFHTCGVCKTTDNFHKDDLTIDVSARDFPDVVASMHDESIWNVLKNKQGGWKKIADHSWCFSFSNDQTIKNIFDALSDDGEFEVLDISDYYIEQIGKFDFVLKGSDPDKKIHTFKKK